MCIRDSFCPDHGFGVIAFSNLRYGPVYGAASRALSIVLERAGLRPRAVAVSAVLAQRKEQVVKMIQTWPPELVAAITAENFLLDRSLADWQELAKARFAAIGDVVSVGPMVPENQLRGAFVVTGAKGSLRVWFSLSPEREPKVQELELDMLATK